MSENLADRFEAAAQHAPERPAVVTDDRSVDYGTLARRTDALAAELHDRGIRSGDRIAIALRNRLEYVELLIASFKLSAIPVNLNRQYVGAELAHVVADAEPSLIVGEETVVRRLRAAGCPLPPLVFVCDDDYRELAEGHRPCPVGADRSGDDRYLLYTGGTTGAPKGVLWRHEDLYLSALGGSPTSFRRRRGESNSPFLDRPVRTFAISPLTHGTAQWLALSCLLRAGTVVLDPVRGAFDAERSLRIIEEQRVSHVVVVGDAFALRILDQLRLDPTRFDTSSVTTILNGGARLSQQAAADLCEHLPGVVIVDGYGTSETGGQGARVVTAGVTGAGSVCFAPSEDTALLDDDLRPLPLEPGDIGRIARHGHVPLGYWRDDAATARSFPTIDGVRYAMTPDIGRVETNGEISLLGRSERLITSGGEKIHPAEIEAAVLDHPAVRDVLVVAGPDERFSEAVTAIVQLEPASDLTCRDLEAWCRPSLAAFKLPRRLRIVDEIQRFHTGKPDLGWAAAMACSDQVDRSDR